MRRDEEEGRGDFNIRTILEDLIDETLTVNLDDLR